jgi:MoxR-like ATPase
MNDFVSKFLASANNILFDREHELKLMLCALLAGGHVLIEDSPGVGKTTLVHLMAKLLGFDFKRVQFTNDLLPADIIGGLVFESTKQQFSFHRGPIFAQMVLGDELNRASPRTQSATLQAMEEHEVTVEGQTHKLPEPFFFVGTQNPRDHAGTASLPESQMDRFLMRLELGRPNRDTQRKLLERPHMRNNLEGEALCTPTEFCLMQKQVENITVASPVRDYILDLAEQAHQNHWPVSPRASIGLQQAARAWAFMNNRNHVLPDDVQSVFVPVFSHRVAFFGKNPDLSGEGVAMAQEILAHVRVR